MALRMRSHMNTRWEKMFRSIWLLSLTVFVLACGGGDGDGAESGEQGETGEPIEVVWPTLNAAPIDTQTHVHDHPTVLDSILKIPGQLGRRAVPLRDFHREVRVVDGDLIALHQLRHAVGAIQDTGLQLVVVVDLVGIVGL